MDTFFAKKKYGKLSWGHTYCQLFVTNKGFVCVIPINLRGEVLQPVKIFAKEISPPEAIIFDAAGEKTYNNLRKLWRDIGKNLGVLEEVTLWVDKYELYLGLIN